jgi:hypothetical protein
MLLLHWFLKQTRREENLTRSSKSKLQIYANASAQLIPEIALNEAKIGKSSSALAKKKKEDADKPIYLNRV